MTILRTDSTHSGITIDYANGVVGPQFDFPSAENGQGIIYFGGSQQYEIVLPKEIDWRGEDWEKYLKEIERLELK